MILKGTLNKINGNRDKENGIFVLEFKDSYSGKNIEITIDRKQMVDIFFGNEYDPITENCTISIPKEIGKTKEQKIIWVKNVPFINDIPFEDIQEAFIQAGLDIKEWSYSRDFAGGTLKNADGTYNVGFKLIKFQ